MFRKRITIDPANLNASTEVLLATLLAANQDQLFFSSKQKFKVLRKDKTVEITLQHPVLRYQRKVRLQTQADESRFAVLSEKLYTGKKSEVYASSISLKFAQDPSRLLTKNKKAGKARAVKRFLQAPSDREFNFLLKLEETHARQVMDLGNNFDGIMMKRLDGEDLIEMLIRDSAKSIFTLEERMNLSISIGEALITLHDQGIIHRDVKADNMKYDVKTSKITLFDFDQSKFASEDTRDIVGTEKPVDYRAPEVKAGLNATEKCDAYSYATLMRSIIWHNIFQHPRFADLTADEKINIDDIFVDGLNENVEHRAGIQQMVKSLKEILPILTEKPRSLPLK